MLLLPGLSLGPRRPFHALRTLRPLLTPNAVAALLALALYSAPAGRGPRPPTSPVSRSLRPGLPHHPGRDTGHHLPNRWGSSSRRFHHCILRFLPLPSPTGSAPWALAVNEPVRPPAWDHSVWECRRALGQHLDCDEYSVNI